MRETRRLARLLAVVRHLLAAIVKVLAMFPFWGEARRAAEIQRWSRRAVCIFGGVIREQSRTALPRSARVLYVANHISWLDVYAILAIADCRFVAKSDVRQWPVIGWLAGKLGTVFVTRRRGRDLVNSDRALAGLLAQGIRVCLFPEGTTSDGRAVLSFTSALLQSAIDCQACIQPVAISYRAASPGAAEAVAFTGEMTLVQSMWRIAGSPGFVVDVALLEPIDTKGRTRRALAALARQRIAQHLGLPDHATPAGAAQPMPQALLVQRPAGRSPVPELSGGGAA